MNATNMFKAWDCFDEEEQRMLRNAYRCFCYGMLDGNLEAKAKKEAFEMIFRRFSLKGLDIPGRNEDNWMVYETEETDKIMEKKEE